MRADEVQTLRLPLSGWVFQTRADGWWRDLSPSQFDEELTEDLVADPDEWAEPGNHGVSGRCEHWPGGDNPAEGWWLLYDSGAPPSDVRLDGGRRPLVIEFGPLWMCEWRSVPLAVEVFWPGRALNMFDHRPVFQDSWPLG